MSLAQLLRHFPRARAGVAVHPVLHEYVVYHPQYDAVVVQRQHRASAQSCPLRCCLAACFSGFLRLGQRQHHAEAAARVPYVLHRYAALHQFRKAFHYRQSQPESVLRGGIAQPLERLEYLFPFVLVYSSSGIFHRQREFPSGIQGGQCHAPAFRKLQCVRQQVAADTQYQVPVAHDHLVSGVVHHELQPFLFHPCGKLRFQRFRHSRQSERLHPDGLLSVVYAVVVQQVLHQCSHTLRRLPYMLRVQRRCLPVSVLQYQFRIAANGGQR